MDAVVRALCSIGVALSLAAAASCEPPPRGPGPMMPRSDGDPDGDPQQPAYAARGGAPHEVGAVEDRMVDFQFDGGQLEFELFRSGSQIEQTVRNRYAVPVVLHFTIGGLANLEPMSALDSVVVLPPASGPLGAGERVVIASLQQLDPSYNYRRDLHFQARFGDPRARPDGYVYGLPYPHGLTFAVLQGFHGSFSHRGSNEYAIDFACPIATPVVAAREGVVIATNAAAQGAGTTPEYMDDHHANFVLILHADGTIGEYQHLSTSGVEVKPGQRVKRGQELALSGNTGFSSTPHLHFQVITAADDGVAKRGFPFQMAVRPNKVATPVQGQRYSAWE